MRPARHRQSSLAARQIHHVDEGLDPQTEAIAIGAKKLVAQLSCQHCARLRPEERLAFAVFLYAEQCEGPEFEISGALIAAVCGLPPHQGLFLRKAIQAKGFVVFEERSPFGKWRVIHRCTDDPGVAQ